MTERLLRNRLSAEGVFFFLCTAVWFLSMSLQPCESSLAMNLLFGAGAALWSYPLLKLLGYFNKIRLYRRKSDVLLTLVAVPLGAAAAAGGFHVLHWAIPCGVREVLLLAPFLSVCIFFVQYLFSHHVLRSGRKRKIVLDLLPEEKVTIIGDIASLGMSPYVELLTRAELNEHLLRGDSGLIDLVVISQKTAQKFDADAMLLRAHLDGIPIVDHRRFSADLMGRIRLEHTDLWSYLMGATPQTPFRRFVTTIKTLTEPIFAFFLILLLSPLGLLIALTIKLTSPGPVLFRQVRTGYLGKNFTVLKFRSMVVDSEPDGPQWAQTKDSRLTPVGAFLRRSRMDELPQLWNVIRGEMSFSGPRPERPEMYQRLKSEIPLFPMRTVIRPGITGWAQVCCGYAASVEESRAKLEYDLYYIQNLSPRLDFIVMVKTLVTVLFGENKQQNSVTVLPKERFPHPEIPSLQEQA